jgi:hypothetical protein
MLIQRKPVVRAHYGLVGRYTPDDAVPAAPASVVSPAASVAQAQAAVNSLMEAVGEANTELQVRQALANLSQKRPGRPRKWANDGERKRVERAAQKQKLEQLLAHFGLALDTKIAPHLREKFKLIVETYRDLLNSDSLKVKLVRAVARDLKEVFKQQRQNQASTGNGKYLRGAPQGKGLLISGGYNSQKTDKIMGIREEEMVQLSGKDFEFDPMGTYGDRRRVTPEGHGPDKGPEDE